MAKLSDQTLDELYSKPKKSKAAEIAIISKSDFSKINMRYCEGVCKLKCKTPNRISMLNIEVDILVVQDHKMTAGKFDRQVGQQDRIQAGVLDFIVKEAGLVGLTTRLVNLSKCDTSTIDYPNGKSPTQTILTKCSPYLYEEIRVSKPKVIISLGTAATKALGLTKYSNTGNRGEIAISPFGPVVMTLHPKITTFIRQNARGSAGMFGPDYLQVIINDFKKAGKIARGKIAYGPDTLKTAVDRLMADRIFIARNMADVVRLAGVISSLPHDVVRSFDTETTGVDPLAPDLRILTLQFGWRDPVTNQLVAAVFPLWHRENKGYDSDKAWKILAPLLLDDSPKVGHNAKFDILVIYWTKGVRVKNVVFDTLLILHSIYSGAQGTYGLKAATWDYLLEEGFAGYENDLGDLKKLQRDADKLAKANGEDDDEVEDLSEFVVELSEDEQLANRVGFHT